jgi:hypothetical protein
MSFVSFERLTFYSGFVSLAKKLVLLWFRQEQILLPVAVDAKAGTISWRLPVYNTVLKYLQNPC